MKKSKIFIVVAAMVFTACGNANGNQPDAGVNKSDTTVTRTSPSIGDSTSGGGAYSQDTLKNHVDSTHGSDSLRK